MTLCPHEPTPPEGSLVHHDRLDWYSDVSLTQALSRTRVGRLLAVESETVAVPASVTAEANEPVSVESPFLQTLVERGFYHQCTNVEGLDEKLRAGEVVKAYLGFDATADRCHRMYHCNCFVEGKGFDVEVGYKRGK